MSSSFNLADVTLGVTPSGDGLKAVPLSSSGCQILWMPDAQTVAFEPSAYQNGDSKRVNLVMRARRRRLCKLWRNLTLTFWISVSRTAPACLERSFRQKRLLPGMHLA